MGRIEIITIGDELVEGRLIDTNSATLSERLAAEGYPVARHVTVRDDPDEIIEGLRRSADRCNAVLVSGGLGPTTDDLTAQCAAEAFGLELVRSERALQHVREFFAKRGRAMSPNNEKQADLPAGAAVLPNPRGTAVGFRLEVSGCRLYFMPGVPRELVGMFNEEILPHLRTFLDANPAAVGQLKVFGKGESDVATALVGLGDDLPTGAQLTVQYRATFPEIHIRLVLEGREGKAAEALMAELVGEARRRLSRHVFAVGGPRLHTTFPEKVVEALGRAGLTLAVADGCTKGVTAQLVSTVEGADTVFQGGVIASNRNAVIEILGVPETLVDEHGGHSEQVAIAMAAGVRDRFGSDIGVALVGTPGEDPHALEGTLAVAVATSDGDHARSYNFPLEPDRFRTLAAYVALGLVRRVIGA
jgi:nicotinamide-nucleotide amidase